MNGSDAQQATAPSGAPLPPMQDRFKKPFKGKGGSLSLGAAGTGRSLNATRVGAERAKRKRK